MFTCRTLVIFAWKGLRRIRHNYKDHFASQTRLQRFMRSAPPLQHIFAHSFFRSVSSGYVFAILPYLVVASLQGHRPCIVATYASLHAASAYRQKAKAAECGRWCCGHRRPQTNERRRQRSDGSVRVSADFPVALDIEISFADNIH